MRSIVAFVVSSVLRKTVSLGKSSNSSVQFEKADDKLFSHVLANTNHVLQQHLPERPNSQYNTRTRTCDGSGFNRFLKR